MRISAAGKSILASHDGPIDNSFLEQFAQFRDFQERSRSKESIVGRGESTTSLSDGKPC